MIEKRYVAVSLPIGLRVTSERKDILSYELERFNEELVAEARQAIVSKALSSQPHKGE